MSQYSITQYYNALERIIDFGGTRNETSIRTAFHILLNEYARGKGLELVTEVAVMGTNGKDVRPDGVLKDTLRQEWGCWESKDESDDIDEEIAKKFAKGYPKENILFEDSNTAVLFQDGKEAIRVSMKDPEALDHIINAFIKYERPEIKKFHLAIEQFKQDIPKVTETLRQIIKEQEENRNETFIKAAKKFLKLCHDSINPEVTMDDVHEMIIQHILTEDIFNVIFDEIQFHKENNIAHELEKVIHTFFTGHIKRTALSKVQSYYQAINANAAGIADHHEKQKFLKVVYETFYKSYNPKAADRLGVVYTPNEIVRFMVQSTDYLLHKHFNKKLEDKGVEILDPATGTGTFICDMIDYIRKEKLEHKYTEEMHANEVAILPYYISNLNIEFTYNQRMGKYKEFENLCFVDTLDNMGFGFAGKQLTVFDAVTEENSKRILKQNGRKISVIIGNPPYNANQMNENDNNKNREYAEIDKRIKDTFIHYSTAQKTKVYDMYARFYRWAFDRLDANGMVAFVTNRSFIDSRTFDGFRKCVQMDFDYAYIIDTKSDVRANPKISGTGHNVFGIQTGVAVLFLVKKAKRENKVCDIQYIALDDFWRKEEKLQWFTENPIEKIPFERAIPDKQNNWINLTDNDFDKLIPVCSKDVKSGKSDKAIFNLISNGIVTARDEWSYDFDKDNLRNKATFFCDFYKKEQDRWNKSDKSQKINDFVKRDIKFGSEIEKHLTSGDKLNFAELRIKPAHFRPFTKTYFYHDRIYTHRNYQQDKIFGIEQKYKNKSIAFLCIASAHELSTLSVDTIFDAGLLKQGNGLTTSVPLYRYDEKGNKHDNITDWGLEQFTKKYKGKEITKEDIFHYTYAVLHYPAYKEKYAQNLKRDFPRIPFYKDFAKWAAWGKALMDLHIGYENAAPYPQLQTEVAELKAGKVNKVKLKADKENGTIQIDEATTITGIPPQAWQYKLGNRSALEWILDQYKEGKPKDNTIAEKFDTYRFADYQQQVLELIGKVTTVSVATMNIINEMAE